MNDGSGIARSRAASSGAFEEELGIVREARGIASVSIVCRGAVATGRQLVGVKLTRAGARVAVGNPWQPDVSSLASSWAARAKPGCAVAVS
jgi:hypothetical protein